MPSGNSIFSSMWQLFRHLKTVAVSPQMFHSNDIDTPGSSVSFYNTAGAFALTIASLPVFLQLCVSQDLTSREDLNSTKLNRAIAILSLDTVHAIRAHRDLLLSFPSVSSRTTLWTSSERQMSFATKGKTCSFFQFMFHFVDLPIVYLWWFCEGSWFWKIGLMCRFEENWLRLGRWAAVSFRNVEIIFTVKAPEPCVFLAPVGRQEGRGYIQPLAACFFPREAGAGDKELANRGVCTDSGPWQHFSHQMQKYCSFLRIIFASQITTLLTMNFSVL